MFLGQLFQRNPRSTSERIWIGTMMQYAFYSVTVLSSTMYTIVVTTKYAPEIDSLEQLMDADLPVIVSHATGADQWNFSKYVLCT